MRTLFILLSLWPAAVWATLSKFEIEAPSREGAKGFVHYRVAIDEYSSGHDILEQRLEDGRWEIIHRGHFKGINIPRDAHVYTYAAGPRGMDPHFIRFSKYSMAAPNAGGLRLVGEDDSTWVVARFGVVKVPVPYHKIDDVVLLDEGMDTSTQLAFEVISIRSGDYGAILLVAGGKYHDPFVIDAKFYRSHLAAFSENFVVYFPGLSKKLNVLAEDRRVLAMTKAEMADYYRGHLAPVDSAISRKTAILTEMIHRLDSDVGRGKSRVWVKTAIRALMKREFPELRLAKDPDVRHRIDSVAEALANLWSTGRIADGTALKSIIERRLETLQADRVSGCELALMGIHGKGAHADSFERGRALRGLNFLHRYLEKKRHQDADLIAN